MSRTGIAVGVGARVAEERKVRGLTQRQLTERAHVDHLLHLLTGRDGSLIEGIH